MVGLIAPWTEKRRWKGLGVSRGRERVSWASMILESGRRREAHGGGGRIAVWESDQGDFHEASRR